MAEMNLDPRLAALLPIMDELKVLRSYLKQLSDRDTPPGTPSWTDADSAPVDAHGLRPPFWYPIKWIDDSLRRIEPHLHARRWPPVWWRFTDIDAALSLLPRNFHRVDADGYFYEPDSDHPGFGKGYIPERDNILAWVDRINDMYQRARRASS